MSHSSSFTSDCFSTALKWRNRKWTEKVLWWYKSYSSAKTLGHTEFSSMVDGISCYYHDNINCLINDKLEEDCQAFCLTRKQILYTIAQHHIGTTEQKLCINERWQYIISWTTHWKEELASVKLVDCIRFMVANS